jgi:ribosome-binding protein aMBF1 (putative translation factor)
MINYKQHQKARSTISLLVRKEKIHSTPCELCDSTKDISGHHLDYNYPEIVVWLCRKCHNHVDREKHSHKYRSKRQLYKFLY